MVTKKLTWACAYVPEAIMSMSLASLYVGYSVQGHFGNSAGTAVISAETPVKSVGHV